MAHNQTPHGIQPKLLENKRSMFQTRTKKPTKMMKSHGIHVYGIFAQQRKQMSQHFKIEKATSSNIPSFDFFWNLFIYHDDAFACFFSIHPQHDPSQPIFPTQPRHTHLATGKHGIGNGAAVAALRRDFCRGWRRFTGLNLWYGGFFSLKKKVSNWHKLKRVEKHI